MTLVEERSERAASMAQLEAEFDVFYRTSFHQVTRAVYGMLGHAEDAFDLSQEAFARSWKDWDRVRTRERPILFTLSVALNLARNHLRWLKLRRMLAPRLNEPGDGSPSDVAATRVDVLMALRQLPSRQRSVLVLHDMIEMSSDEVGEVLGIAPSTVRVHLTRGRHAFRAALGADPSTPTDTSGGDSIV